MAGHSKWSQIKHKKAKEDSKRGKLFTKLIKEITIAARMGGGDPAGNARLRLLLEKAKEINMPQDNSVRAIKRGTSEIPGQSYESYMYEGYGPGNIALIVEVLTDNKNRAIAEMRTTFTRKGGIVAQAGAVSWLFGKFGVIRIPSSAATEEALLELLIDHEITDINSEDNVTTITCDLIAIEDIKQILSEKKIKIESAEIEWVPQSTIEVSADNEEKAYEFLQALEDLDDVQNVYTNLG